MKNKHLVLLFFAALVVGLLTRKLPWSAVQLFETELVRIDTLRLTQLSVTLPGHPELTLERTENGWAATQNNRSVAVLPAAIMPMLNALSPIVSVRIVKTNRPDTLNLDAGKRIQLALFDGEKSMEHLYIGKETREKGQDATYIQLGNHEGIYLVKGYLRRVFSKKIDDFRMNTVAEFDPSLVRTFEIKWPDSAAFRYEKNDSTGFWMGSPDTLPPIANKDLQQWLNGFQRLNTSRFADHFDESRAAETLLAELRLFYGSEMLELRFFHLLRPDIPEEVPESPVAATYLATYFVHSSQNSLNYFALPDSTMARQICFGPPRPPKPF